jgi:molybdopterin/thiamine biosynthesis adenylyltransferase
LRNEQPTTDLRHKAINFRPTDDRFGRQKAIPGWSQEVLSSAKVLVAGAGALGNETLKNLALVGVGTIGIIDRDVVEMSNLSRSVLFREEDLGQPKALVAAGRIKGLNPNLIVHPYQLDLTTDLGAGSIEKYDLLLGCVDSIEARWKLNRLCRAARVAWIDAGIDAGMGQISFFAGSGGPCYECSMNDSMWNRIHERRSCLLTHTTMPERSVATTAIIASMIASLQVQEAIAYLHQASSEASQWSTLRPGDLVSLTTSPYVISTLHGKVREDCLAPHAHREKMMDVHGEPDQITIHTLLTLCEAESMELDWDVAVMLTCLTCGPERVCAPAWLLSIKDLSCPQCFATRSPEWRNRFQQDPETSHYTLKQIGLPALAHLELCTKSGQRITVRLT